MCTSFVGNARRCSPDLGSTWDANHCWVGHIARRVWSYARIGWWKKTTSAYQRESTKCQNQDQTVRVLLAKLMMLMADFLPQVQSCQLPVTDEEQIGNGGSGVGTATFGSGSWAITCARGMVVGICEGVVEVRVAICVAES